MKKILSALDIQYLIKEFSFLKNAKVDKIYLAEQTLLIQFHVKNHGKVLLKSIIPGLIFITDHKEKFTKPNKLCVALRKYLNNTRLREIIQKKFERIIEFIFEGKDQNYKLIIELFSKGNLILCKQDYTIIIAKDYHKWGQRTIRGGIKYEYPKKRFSPVDLTLESLSEIVNSSNKENIVKMLALDLGLGGVYSEELCALSKIKKKNKILSKKEIEVLFKNIKKILAKKIKAVKYESKDITPFELEIYKKMDKKKYASFSQALDDYSARVINLNTKREFSSKYDKKKNLLLSIQKQQIAQINGLEIQAKESQEKGENIYHNYKLVETLLEELKQIRKNYSWKQIKEKIKDHKLIKEMKEREGKIVVEI